MERWTKPVALVTTFQPYLVIWLLAISFFLTLTFVAVVSKGRSIRDLAVIFMFGYLVLIVVSILTTQWFADIQIIAFELVSASG